MTVRRYRTMLLLLACALPATARAQDAATDAYALAPPSEAAADVPAAPATDPDDALGKALTFAPAALSTAPLKPLRLPGYPAAKGLDVSRADNPDGSSKFTVKPPLPIDVDTKFGADFAPTASSTLQPGSPLPGSGSAYDSGAAWASIGVPNLASVDARVDPDSDQGKLGTTLRHAMPVGSRFAVTVQDTFSVTDTLGARNTGNAGEPLLAAVPPATPAPAQVWGNEQKLKFDVLPTGTSLSAGIATSSLDPVTHHSLSAEQKIYGPLHVTTSVNDIGEATASRSISAGLKLNW
jgi:hypothetical protein